MMNEQALPLEVLIADEPRDATPAPAAGAEYPSSENTARQAGSRSPFQERLSQLRARAGRAEDRSRELEERVAALQSQLASVAERTDTVGRAVLADVVGRDRSLKAQEIDQRIADLRKESVAAMADGELEKHADIIVRLGEALLERREVVNGTGYANPVAAQPSRPPAPQPQAPQESPGLRAFKQRNPWFMKDPELTDRAMQVHAQFVREAPEAIETPEYYRLIEEEVARARNPAPPPLSGGSATAQPVMGQNGKVRLTLPPEAVAVARRLGLSPEEYARTAYKLAGSGKPTWVQEAVR